jgi:hypothetical protein
MENEKAMYMRSKYFCPEFKKFHTEEWEQYLYSFGWSDFNPSPQK